MVLYSFQDNCEKQVLVNNISFDRTCDVLCVGAGCAGIYAADAAAREGADVILLENSANIGGMHVSGYVMSYYYGAQGGSFEEDDKACLADKQVFANSRWPDAKQVHVIERLQKSGVTLLCRHTPIGVYFEGNCVIGLKVFDGKRSINVKSKMVIDATSDGHIIRMCPVTKYYGRPLDGKTVPFTVRTQYIKDGRHVSINADSGYTNQYDNQEFSRKTIFSHANAGRYINEGEFLNVALHTGIREGLSYEGEEVLKYSDIIYDKPPKKVLFYAYSDLDKHGHDHAMDDRLFQNWWVVSNLATVTARIPVPMGSIVPRGIEGLVTAGRCLSCDSYAQSAVRMNRDMFRMGECAGVAAAMAVKSGKAFLEIDYDTYVEKVKQLGCYEGEAKKKFGFDYPGKNKPYVPVNFDVDSNLPLLKTETPGVAIWSCFVAKNKTETAENVFALLCDAEKQEDEQSTLWRYNCAIALGIMEDQRALPVLREMVEKRDCFYFKDCRRSNQFRSAVALCLLGRLGDESDLAVLEEIVFGDTEFDREMYHTLAPDYLYYAAADRNFVYFDIFTHACMALVEISKRSGKNLEKLYGRLEALFAGEKIIRRVTDTKSDEPTYIEIADFQSYILKVLKQ